MFEKSLAMVSLALLSGSLAAQSQLLRVPGGVEPRHAGTYHVTTGRFTPSAGAPESAPAVIYNNTCNTLFYFPLTDAGYVIDEGRIPSRSSTPSGVRDSYRVSSLEIGYRTDLLDASVGGPGVSVRIRIFEDYDDCTPLAMAGTPIADITATGLPGVQSDRDFRVHVVTLDLSGSEFCLKADADGVFDGVAASDKFGYVLSMPGAPDGTGNGILTAGDPLAAGCAFGDGTFYYNPGSATGTGLDNSNSAYWDDPFVIGALCYEQQPGEPYTAAYLKITADLDDDLDSDGIPDCEPDCPAGDSDGDGTPDCSDGCPNDPGKVAPGVCGCGTSDTDTDGDAVADCVDGCAGDPLKIAPGICGCGVSDADDDGDGTASCDDGCPADPDKIDPGVCGCGTADTDSDGDGTADCVDSCPDDPAKIAPGICGCGFADSDADGDGTADCFDGCPGDPGKTDPGVCGCGVADDDSDGDGAADCVDGCPGDPGKSDPGICGCGVTDTDSDGDGAADCVDGCPDDPVKVDPGTCGCGVADDDTDVDGIADCEDNCPAFSNPGQEDCNNNGVGDVCDIAASYSFDANGSGVPDECENNGTSFCIGDGSDIRCPCLNLGGAGQGCANSSGLGAQLYNIGGISVGANDTQMVTIHLPTNKFGLVFMGNNNLSLAFGDGRLCIFGGTIKRFQVKNSGALGTFTQANLIPLSNGLIVSGSPWNFQSWYRDPNGPCGHLFNLSNAVGITFTP